MKEYVEWDKDLGWVHCRPDEEWLCSFRGKEGHRPQGQLEVLREIVPRVYLEVERAYNKHGYLTRRYERVRRHLPEWLLTVLRAWAKYSSQELFTVFSPAAWEILHSSSCRLSITSRRNHFRFGKISSRKTFLVLQDEGGSVQEVSIEAVWHLLEPSLNPIERWMVLYGY